MVTRVTIKEIIILLAQVDTNFVTEAAARRKVMMKLENPVFVKL